MFNSILSRTYLRASTSSFEGVVTASRLLGPALGPAPEPAPEPAPAPPATLAGGFPDFVYFEA